jgi:hypothetical protein
MSGNYYQILRSYLLSFSNEAKRQWRICATACTGSRLCLARIQAKLSKQRSARSMAQSCTRFAMRNQAATLGIREHRTGR